MKPEDQAAFEQAKNKTLTDERKLEIIKNSELWDMHIHMGWYSVPSKSFVEKSFKLIDDIQAACAHRDAQPAVACSFPERDVTKPAEEQGLFRKFDVRRVDGSDAPGGKHHGCEYFVLDLDHDIHAPAAIRAYAQACNETHPQLSAELSERFGPQPAVAQEPVGFRYKTRSIKYPENGWSGWHFQEGVPANYHLTDDGNFEFLTRLLYDHSTPDVAPTEVLRELVEALNDFSNYVHAEQSSTDGHVQYSNTQIIRLAFKARSALKSAKEHGL